VRHLVEVVEGRLGVGRRAHPFGPPHRVSDQFGEDAERTAGDDPLDLGQP
jgi:hypothetical protein